MRLIVDTHGHLYPRHDPRKTLQGARDRLEALAHSSGAEEYRLILCLLDRADESAFSALRARCALDGLSVDGCPADSEALRVRFSSGSDLWICSGRQVATAERLEVLALGQRPSCPDGLSLQNTLHLLRKGPAAAMVLPWAFGKWVGRRGRKIQQVLHTETPDTLLLGDSSLRPLGLPDRLLTIGRTRGYRIVAGTDPLPPSGEESMAGSFATCLDGDWDDLRPSASLVRLLMDPQVVLTHAGRRSTPWTVARRLIRAARRPLSHPVSQPPDAAPHGDPV